jgi:serine/threonine-protein kinase
LQGRYVFEREIQIASRLTHPHIMPLHDSRDADGRLFYSMAYIEGERVLAPSAEPGTAISGS